MTNIRKHNSVILRAWKHSIIVQILSIMCQGLPADRPEVLPYCSGGEEGGFQATRKQPRYATAP